MGRDLPEAHPLHRLFRGLTEYVFHAELGLGDPRLVAYVAGMLARFVPAANLYRPRDDSGHRLTEVTAMLAAAEATNDETRRREYHQHVGDFTLFWTGVFPEAVPRLQASGTAADQLLDYNRQGKRSYYLASTYSGEDAPLLRRLSAEFDLCAHGLSRVREEWESLSSQRSGLPHFLDEA